jgi:drug/metabolite transporter (DMT)-like permease
MTRSRAVLFLFLAATLFSTAGLFIKIISISPLALVGARSLIAALIMALWLRRPHFTWNRYQIGGAISLLGAQLFFVVATRQTTAANAVFIQFTAPVYVALLGIWFLGERARPLDWATMLIIGLGLFLFFGDELTPQGFWGNVNALISGISLACLMIFLRKQKDGSTAETMLLGNLLAAAIGLPFLLRESPTLADWGGVLFLGIFQLGIPFILMSVAIRTLTAVEAILIQTLEPVLNPIWVFLVVGELPTPLALFGGLIVLTAVTLRALLASRGSLKTAVSS